MSTYSTSEAALLTLIQAYNSGATFTDDNSSRGDFGVLDAKNTNVSCVLMQAAASDYGDNLGNGRGTQGKRQQRHFIGVTVFSKRKQAAGGDGVAYTRLTATVDALIAHIDRYQRLNGAAGVKRAQATEGGDVRFREQRPWLWQTILVQVETETAPVLVETAQ